jgi:hypothetical protein
VVTGFPSENATTLVTGRFLACIFQKLDKQPADLLRLLLLNPVSRSLDEMGSAHLRARGALHPLKCAGC